MELVKIFSSRLKKESKEDFVKERIKVCLKCPKNTLNLEVLSLKARVFRFLSKSLDKIMFVKRKDYGACSVCYCPIALLTEDPQETCGEQKLGNKSRWKI